MIGKDWVGYAKGFAITSLPLPKHPKGSPPRRRRSHQPHGQRGQSATGRRRGTARAFS
jgi:hypothetical protein